MSPRLLLTLAVLAAASTATAHHRQTPPVVAITTSGEGALPRLPPPSRKAAAVTVDDSIAVVSPFRNPTVPTFSFASGSNASPSISSSGRTVVWDSDADPLGSGAPGRQVLRNAGFDLDQVAVDPTGTSANAAVDLLGIYVAFESTADLAATGTAGTRQIFLESPAGTIAQISRGTGTSRNPSVGKKGRSVVFESTSDPVSGADAGVEQVWIADLVTGATGPVTHGAAPSRSPSLSSDGRLIVFESRADLAGDGHDTTVAQIFAYDTVSRTFARVTSDAADCTAPTTLRIKRDWRIAYLCGGTAYFTMLRANARYRVQTDGGDTTRLVPQADAHFMLVATTANLLDAGTTATHLVYMVNLFKRAPESVPGAVVWFPTQGIPPL
ncbi:MAG TPA: hypothetical protein VMS22_17940 [Candidatus Eisenbacteria bacterium]|nr:hypothetical protein [Candidatus Eisenbacteria bacterium]